LDLCHDRNGQTAVPIISRVIKIEWILHGQHASQAQVNEIFGSASTEEISGIVKRMHLNPPTGMAMLLEMIKNIRIF
jgi:hypothetical protein